MNDKKNNQPGQHDERLPAAGTGNASNPSRETAAEGNRNQLLDEKAETYIREAGNIEDMPDENDQQDMDETIRQS